MRNINDILQFRTDITPFLTHLTRDCETGNDDKCAKKNLRSILLTKELRAGEIKGKSDRISDVRYGGNTSSSSMSQCDALTYFSAVCFTETPLAEIHCLLEIERRNRELQPYGLVFLKRNLYLKGVCPVIHLNNHSVSWGEGENEAPQDDVTEFLFGMIKENPDIAARLLPLVSIFGNYIKGPHMSERHPGIKDFLWEREWRLPKVWSPLKFSEARDVFIGLCPHEEIEEFESEFPDVKFVDPRCTQKWYADKLIDKCRQHELSYSIV